MRKKGVTDVTENERNAQRLREDEAVRGRIVNETDRNFFVEASAGSGKTTLLVRRMAGMVRAGIPVEKITAITFTKAAAKEFYNRFQSKLAELSTDSSLTETERERCALALRNVDLAFMGTIDAFCGKIISEHPSEAGVPGNSSVKTEEELMRVYVREYRELLRGGYGPELLEKYERFRKYQENAREAYLSAIPVFMRKRNGKVIFEPEEECDVDVCFAKEIAELREVLVALGAHPEFHSSTKEQQEKYKALRDKLPILTGSWEERVPDIIALLKKLDKIRSTVEPLKAGLPDYGLYQEHSKREKYYELCLTGAGSVCEALAGRRYAAAMDFLESFAAAMAERLEKNGELGFFDYILCLRNMLKKDAAGDGNLIRQIFRRHSSFLIDESQDTDPLQSEIFFYLAAEKPVPDWTACVPRPGSLFIVGDPKQSIYRFKGADVASFLRVKGLFREPVGEVVCLYRNFRSTRRMTAYFNRKFTELLPEESASQSRFDEIPFGTQYAKDEGLTGAFRYRADEYDLPELIADLVHDPKYRIREAYDKPLREIDYRDVMVITKDTADVALLASLFRENNIPFLAEGNKSFGDCPALCAACAVIGAAARPRDSVAVYRALTSPAFRFRDSELFAWVSAGGKLTLRPQAGNGEPIALALKELTDFAALLKDTVPSAMLSLALDRFHLPERAGTDYLEHAVYARQLLCRAETAGEVSTEAETADFLEKLISGASGLERSLSLDKSGNRVHLANLHKVKGLEAPVVILTAGKKKKHTPTERTERGSGEEISWIFSLKRSGHYGGEICSTSRYEDKKNAETAAVGEEYLRLLYVAATRAKSLLLVPTLMKKDRPDDTDYWYPLAERCDGDLEEFIEKKDSFAPSAPSVDVAKAAALAEEENPFRNRAPEQASYAIARPSQLVIRAKSAAEDEYDDRTDEEAKSVAARRNAALLGTMVHRLMEELVASGGKADPGKLAERISGEYDLAGADGEELKKILITCGKKISSGGYAQTNGLPADILSELLSADEVHCELPFSRREGDMIFHGIMDAVYRKDGAWHVVDYKTNADGSELDEKYLAQLQAYREAFFALTGEQADARTYHIPV